MVATMLWLTWFRALRPLKRFAKSQKSCNDLLQTQVTKEERDGVIAVIRLKPLRFQKRQGTSFGFSCANDRLEVLGDIVEELGRLRDEALAIERDCSLRGCVR